MLKGFLIIITMVLVTTSIAGCSTYVTSPTAITQPKTTERPATSSPPVITRSPVPSTPNSPRLTVALDYFGIKSTHQPALVNAANTIQLLAVVEDGKTAKQFSYPSTKANTIVKDFSLQDLKSQIIFQTTSVGDHLKLSVLAYSCADKDTALAILDAFQSYNSSQGTAVQFYNNLPQSKQLIGYYEHTWSAAENWGSSQNEYQESDRDLTFWFRIWSANLYALVTKPKFLPEVKIQSVILPTAKVSFEPYIPSDYNTSFRLVNNEPVDLTINWQANSSATGNFDSGSVLVPKNGFVDVTKLYHYTTTGTSKMTYTISYNGAQVDTWSDNMSVTFFPDVKIVNMTLPTNVRVGTSSYRTTFRLVNNEPIDIVVHWQLNSSILIYDGANVIVPKNSYIDITSQYQYKNSGKDYITYIISYNGNQIDTWKGDMDIASQPQ